MNNINSLKKNNKQNNNKIENITKDKKTDLIQIEESKIKNKLNSIKQLLYFTTNLDYNNIWNYNDFWNSDKQIEQNITKKLNTKWTKFYHFNVAVNIQKEDIKQEILNKLPPMISRFVFDREWFTWVRYYVFETEKSTKLYIWFYGRSMWRWNDLYFKNIHKNFANEDNVKKINIKLTDILNTLKLKK